MIQNIIKSCFVEQTTYTTEANRLLPLAVIVHDFAASLDATNAGISFGASLKHKNKLLK